MIPSGVEVAVKDGKIFVAGSKGKLEMTINSGIKIENRDGQIFVLADSPEDRQNRALWGTLRALVANMVTGVSAGFSKKLEIIGVGYRAQADKNKLTMQLGYSHPVELAIPADLEVKVEKNTITVTGIDKRAVGEFSASIRSRREPEPYKGKGIKYADEVIRRKAGKVVKAVGG